MWKLLFCMSLMIFTGCSVSIIDNLGPPVEPYAFVPVEREPSFDIAELNRVIVYPPAAKVAKIEGSVVVRVLVRKSGIAGNYLVESATSTVFVPETVRAVMLISYSPAIQNGQPIDCWISVTVVFKL
jgi:TonB family protein